jgi:hypothetical protein
MTVSRQRGDVGRSRGELSDCRWERLCSAAPRLLPGSRSSRLIRMQVDAIRPLRDEAIVLMADQNFRRMTVDPIVFRQLNGGTKRLGFAWESCGHTAMRVLDFPSAIVVDHDISRFMQLFLQPAFIHVRQEITRGRARKFECFFGFPHASGQVTAGNGLDASACLCVGAVVRNRQNQPRPSSPLWPVDTRRH